MPLTETLTWWTPAERMPDADVTVMVEVSDPDASEPVWPGWFDGEVWHDALGDEVTVIRWADMPKGGGK